MSTSCLSSMEKLNYVEVVHTDCDAVSMHCRQLEKNRQELIRRLRPSQLLAESMRRPQASLHADYGMLQVNQGMSSQETQTAGSPQDFQLLGVVRQPTRGWILAIIGGIVATVLTLTIIAVLNRGTSHRAFDIPREGHLSRRAGHPIDGRVGKPGAVSGPRSVLPR